MRAGIALFAAGLALFAPAAPSAEAPGADSRAPDTVADYESRLEEISKELSAIRQELDRLIGELARGDLSRVFVFFEAPAPERVKKGVRLVVDGKQVFSRPFTPAELDVLNRGLPVELAALWLPAGEHDVALGDPGDGEPARKAFSIAPGSLVSWVAGMTGAGVEWRAE